MRCDWSPLDAELDRWREAGLVLPLWWRDDDAVEQTPALERLHALSGETGIPVHLAVIPAHARPGLAEFTRDRENLVPLVHGWSHANTVPKGQKRAEFGAHRPVEAMTDDCRRALQRMEALFGDGFVPVFVPPWNRVCDALIARLPECGYCAISTFRPRDAVFAAPGLCRVNTHLDPVAWRGGRSLADPDTLIRQVARALADRRTGQADPDEPYGILTHHLVHDEEIWQFAGALLRRLRAGPAELWTARELDRNHGGPE